MSGLAGAALGAVGGAWWANLAPEIGKRRFGLSMPGSDPESVVAAEMIGADLRRVPEVLNFFIAWEWRAPFPKDTLDAIRRFHALPEITWEPWDPREDAEQPKYALDRLGDYDEYVDEFARSCAEYGHPIAVRFAHEMNSDWYPWSAMVNGGSASAYVDAYHRLRERVIAQGATNVKWVWCPNIVYKDRPDLIVDSYPGDDAVDVIAVDGYNYGGQRPEDLFGPTLEVLSEISTTKPLWINEIGCANEDKPTWIGELFTYLRDTRVDTVVWFELDTPDRPDWRLLSTPASADAARSSLNTW